MPLHSNLDSFVYKNGDVDIFIKHDGAWKLWLVVRESALLKSLGVKQKGLYAATTFPKDTVLGRYVGRILGRVGDPATDQAVDDLSHSMKGDALLELNGFYVDGRRPVQSNEEQRRLFGKIVLKQPDYQWPGMYAHLANDSRGTSRRNTARVTKLGYVKTMRALQPFDFSKSIEENAHSEILWSYGPNFWSTHNQLGTNAKPIRVFEN